MKYKSDYIQLLYDQHTSNLSFHTVDPQSVIETLAAPKNVWTIFRDQCRSIDRDDRLAPKGRTEKKADARDKALAELRKWYAKVDSGLGQHEEQLVSELRKAMAQPKPKDQQEALQRAVQSQEIRNQVRGMKPEAREVLYRSASLVVREALDEIPIVRVDEKGFGHIEPYVTAKVRDQALMAEAETRFPDKTGLLGDIRALREKYTIFRNAVEQETYKVAGRPATEPVIFDGTPVARTS